MSIQFEQVEGVVQREGDGPEMPQGSGTAGEGQGSQRPPAEQFQANHNRMEWMTRRLMAD
jgi:hypothetical protein